MAALSSSAFAPSTAAPPIGAGGAAQAQNTEPGAESEVATAALLAADADAAGSRAAANDRSFDFSLRVLTVLVLVGLLGSVSLLGYRWIEPRIAAKDEPPVQTRTEPRNAAPAAANAAAAPPAVILKDPRKPYVRCEDQGKVTYSDQECAGGSTSPTPPSPAPAARH